MEVTINEIKNIGEQHSVFVLAWSLQGRKFKSKRLNNFLMKN